MMFTKIAWVFGLVLVAAMLWLAIGGLSIVVPFVLTGLVLVVLIGGGNLIAGRPSASRGARGRQGPRESR